MKKRKRGILIGAILVAMLVGEFFIASRTSFREDKDTEMAKEETKTEAEKVAEIIEEFGTNYSIKYRLLDDETLVVSGIGELIEIDSTYDAHDTIDPQYKIKKVIIEDGITKVSGTMWRLLYLEEVVLPDSVTEIEGGFWGCENLKEMVLPDSITKIGAEAFANCTKLEKIVLPASLKSWDPTILEKCPSLREIVNRSHVECEIPWYKKNVTWTVEGEKTTVIPAGKTAVATGKQIPIRYDLMGGKATGVLPESYEFGRELELPTCVEKEDYVFMGWSDYFGFPVTTVGPEKETEKIYAQWFNAYKVESNKKGQVTVTFDRSDYGKWMDGVYIRYSRKKDMYECEMEYSGKVRDSITIKKLKPGEKYYFELVNGEYDEEEASFWDGFAKRKVVVKG